MESILIVVHLLLSLAIIGLVLIQHGKGADAGAAFGSGAGASSTVFGARGSGNFLTRATSIAAVAFFATSLALAGFAMRAGNEQGLMGSEPKEPAETLPISVTQPVDDTPVLPLDDASDVPVIPGASPVEQAPEAESDVPQF